MVKFWGDGYDLIDPATVRMIGPGAVDIIPAASNLTDDHLIVKFSKLDAFSIIPDPTPGEKPIIITITGETDDPNGLSIFSFEYAVKIVGSKK